MRTNLEKEGTVAMVDFAEKQGEGAQMRGWRGCVLSDLIMVGFATCVSSAALGSTNVFDDAVFWFRGGKDRNGDHCMQQGEFFDDLHADDESHVNHSMMQMLSYSGAYTGFRENAAVSTEAVVFPAFGASAVKNMQVLHLPNKAIKNNNVDYYWPQCFAPGDIFSANRISNEYTIVSRMRLDDDDFARTQCVYKIGYNAVAKQGMWLGFSEIDETTKTKYITGHCTSSINDSDAQFDFKSIRIPTNTWFDMAVVVGGGRLRVGITLPKTYSDIPIIVFAQTNMWTEGCQLLGGTYYRMFGENSQNRATVRDNMEKSCFIGSVQQLAIWDRALSDQEVMAAFGMPRPAIFRTGFDNGGSNEFGGTRSGASQTIDGLGSWQNIANTMKAGDTWTVNFNALRDEAGLPQIFTMKSLTGSAAAQIEPVLNGTSLGERRVEGNGRVFWPVADNLVSAGANTLVITRKDDGAGDFALDAMELGGSLGVGTDDDSISDGRTAPIRTATGVPSAADPNLQHWPQGLQPYTGITNLHFRVWVDPDVTNKASFVFKTATQCASRSATQTASGSEYFSILINGKDKGKRRINADKWPETEWTTHTLSFTPGELIGGWNDFEFVALPYKTCHWFFDYYRFETVLPRAFSLPAPGLTVVVR